MKKKEPRLSRAELGALAQKSHLAICDFLNKPGILSALKGEFVESAELTLLKIMLKSKCPFEVKDKEVELGKDLVAKSTVSAAAKRLDDVLRKFSKQFQVLTKEEIVISIPRKKGGAQVGYFLCCLSNIDDGYLDPEDTTKYLRKAYQKWKEGSEDQLIGNAFKNYICEFSSFIEDRTRDFVGREFVFEAIEKFIKNNESGYFLIRGDPGIGKSSVIAELIKRDCLTIYHFNIALQAINTPRQFLANTCARLIMQFNLPYTELPADFDKDGAFFSKLLAEVAANLNDGNKLVIAVDALDELERSVFSSTNPLYLPSSLPKGVYFV
ncbi:MAG: ATP-binding protein, partial [Candidatus Sifarchaeia archaeon]